MPPASSNRAYDAYASSRFYVEIDGKKEAVFTEVSGVQLEMETMDYQEGGNNAFIHRLPGRVKSGNITLKRGVVRSNEFFQWFTQIAQGKMTRKNVSVVFYDTAGKQLERWEYVDCYPVKWVAPTMTATSSTMAVETLELAHRGLQPLAGGKA